MSFDEAVPSYSPILTSQSPVKRDKIYTGCICVQLKMANRSCQFIPCLPKFSFIFKIRNQVGTNLQKQRKEEWMKHSSKILDNGVDQKADKVITWIDVRKEDDHGNTETWRILQGNSQVSNKHPRKGRMTGHTVSDDAVPNLIFILKYIWT